MDSGNSSSSRLESALFSADVERHLLGCCFVDGNDVVAQCLEAGVAETDFHDPRYRIIYGAMLRLFGEKLGIDVVIVADSLTRQQRLEEVGGLAFLAEVSSAIPTTAYTSYFIARVRDLSRQRRLVEATRRIMEAGLQNQDDVSGFIDRAEQQFYEAAHARETRVARHIREHTIEVMTLVTKLIEQKGQLTGLSSGFRDLDALLSGFQRSDMIVLAARPSMGKTALALNFAEAAALPRHGPPLPTLIFSFEMSGPQIGLRLLCARARVNATQLRGGFIAKKGNEHEQLVSAAQEMRESPLYIDDSTGITIHEIRAKARRLHLRHPLSLIVVDYLQLIAPTNNSVSRELQVAEASRGLKSLAKELNVPVLVLSQLNRSPEKENRAPKLADLRESGSIEQDADVVLLLSRPKDAEDRFQVAADTADLIVAKQRNGPVGEIKLTFVRNITRFENHARN